MNILIVEEDMASAAKKLVALEGLGFCVRMATTASEAVQVISCAPMDVIVLDLLLSQGRALAIADLAAYRQPNARLILLTSGQYFADGSIFSVCSNAVAILRTNMDTDDLCAIIAHHVDLSVASRQSA